MPVVNRVKRTAKNAHRTHSGSLHYAARAPAGPAPADVDDEYEADFDDGSAGDPTPRPVSKKPRENPGFSDFGGLYLGRIPVDSAPSWTVDHLCTSSRDRDTKIARIDSYKVMLKRS